MRYRNTLKILEEDLQLIEEKYSVEDQNENAFVLAADKARDAGKKEFEFPKGSGKMHPVTIKADIEEEVEEKIENYQETSLDEKKRRKRRKRRKRDKQKASDIPGYRRGTSKKQLKKLDRVTKKAASGKFTSADYEREDKRRQRELPKGHKTPKNPFTGKIAVGEAVKREELRSLLEEIIRQEIEEKKKRKKRKKKAKRKTLSKKTMATLRKKAKSSGYTAGSLASEYRKGLGAYYTSGSRKGMGAHQWAMARVNSAIGKGNPSWANLKRSKAKKK